MMHVPQSGSAASTHQLPSPPPPQQQQQKQPPPTPSTSVSIPASVVLPSSSKQSTFGHDRQPSVQLKIEASGGPPLQAKGSLGAKLGRHLSYFGSLLALLSRLSPIVQSISALLILVYLTQLHGDVVVDFFSLTPGEIISPGQWYHTVISLWSHVFLETRLLSLLIDLLLLFFYGTLIEPLWGAKEVVRFLVIACIPSALLTAIHYILLYCITYDVAFLFNVRIHGFLPFCAAVFVTVKQLLPQSVLFMTPLGRFKNDHIPFTVFVLVVLLYFLNILAGVQVLTFTYGILTSWLYLRFLQPHTRHSISSLSSGPTNSTTTTITRGDLSDSFAFETFFPNVLRPLVAVFTSWVYNFFVYLNICPPIPSPAARLLNEQNNLVSRQRQTPWEQHSANVLSKSYKYYPQKSVFFNSHKSQATLSESADMVQPLMQANSVETL